MGTVATTRNTIASEAIVAGVLAAAFASWLLVYGAMFLLPSWHFAEAEPRYADVARGKAGTVVELDALIVIGGDGTMLGIARELAAFRVPLIGINQGRLGFVTDIPLEAYDYVVNGKPALEWIMERYQITVDKDSGIRNDPNDWAREHKQPRYILDLLKRIVRVSLETMKIVNALPGLNEVTEAPKS